MERCKFNREFSNGEDKSIMGAGRKKKIILFILIIALLVVGYLEYRGYIWHNEIFASKYHENRRVL